MLIKTTRERALHEMRRFQWAFFQFIISPLIAENILLVKKIHYPFGSSFLTISPTIYACEESGMLQQYGIQNSDLESHCSEIVRR